jgi:tRNA (adenine57-N1/adenine58-N1)-methyltransferase
MEVRKDIFKPGELCTVRIIKKNFVIRLEPGGILHTNKGYIRHDDIIGQPPGTKLLTNLNKPAYLFRPSIEDLIFSVKRFTNISYPKEIAWIIYYLGINNGKVVLEAGTGSGSLALALAYFVGSDGKVVSCDYRSDFSASAAENLKKAGMLERVELRTGRLEEVVWETDYFDACVLDIPEPWEALRIVLKALKPGAPLIIFVPTVNQVERTVKEIRRLEFLPPETLEILHRYWDVKTGATRPEFEMRGHTGFLIQTRKLLVRPEEEI